MKRTGVLALAVIAAVVPMGCAQGSRMGEPETPPKRVRVERDRVLVYSRMATTGIVVLQLKRGDLVEVEPIDTTSEGAWCRVKEAVIGGGWGYARCEDLERTVAPAGAPPKVASRPEAEVAPAAEKPPQAPPSTREPSPELVAKVKEPAVTVKKRYTVQVAALVVERNVIALEKRLENLGYTPIIRKTTAPITRHRVYAGEFNSHEEAERTARKLNVDGFTSNVVTIQGGRFAPEVGSFLRLNQAIDLAHNLQQKNYTAKIVSEPTPTPVHRVRVGEYQSRAEALKAVEVLKGQGFSPFVVRQ